MAPSQNKEKRLTIKIDEVNGNNVQETILILCNATIACCRVTFTFSEYSVNNVKGIKDK